MDEMYDQENGDYPSEELRLQALCYEILVIAGEYDFSRLMKNLEKFLAHLSEAESAHRQKQEVKEREQCLRKTLHGETMKVDAYEAAS